MSEELIVRNCAPTLARLKTGSLFNSTFVCRRELYVWIERMNRRLTRKGLRLIPLRIAADKALLYLYRPSKLQADFSQREAAELLRAHGYESADVNGCIVRLIKRIKDAGSDFPHEIGLFLGYPPEDVRGFMEESAARPCKCVGCWKVYGDEVRAQRLFSLYKKCTGLYVHRLKSGIPLERLTVAG